MCGEIDEQLAISQEVLERFQGMSKMLGLDATEAEGAPENLASGEGRATYMEAIFNAGLARALGDAAAAEEDETVDAIASQAIALARLAGILAGQLPREADLFRACVEALGDGHNEPRALMAQKARDHDAAHGHSHDEDGGHSHDHTHGHDHGPNGHTH